MRVAVVAAQTEKVLCSYYFTISSVLIQSQCELNIGPVFWERVDPEVGLFPARRSQSHAAGLCSRIGSGGDMSAFEPSLPPELERRVADELAPGERLVWTGQPRPDLAMRPAGCLVPFGIVFAVFAVFWMVGATVVTGGFLAPCGLPFLGVGIALIASPAWLRRQARNTVYALTDRRALVWEPGWFGSVTVRSYTAAGLGHMSRSERADGGGDLVFEEFSTTNYSNDGPRSYTTRRGFLGIDRVRAVEELVRQTLLSQR